VSGGVVMAENRMLQQMGEIGLRYLKRTLVEIATLRGLLDKLRAGETSRRKEIEQLSHKIHGSGAMFGFDNLSHDAHQVELLAAGDEADSVELYAKLERLIGALEDAAAVSARERGIQ